MNQPSTPTVSAIVIARNAEAFLAESLDSIEAQTVLPTETIVIGGHSCDRTEEIARSYSSVRYIQQNNDGIPNAYNQGISTAEGSLLAFLSADDRWRPEKLERQIASFQEHPASMYTITHFRYFAQEGANLPRTFNRGLLGRDLKGRIMETLVARREVFDLVGEFNPSLPVAEDVDWFARAKDLSVPMHVLPDVLLDKRIHGDNSSTDPVVNTPALMVALRASVKRQRTSSQGIQPRSGENNG